MSIWVCLRGEDEDGGPRSGVARPLRMDELGTKWQQLEGCHWAAASDSDRERAWRRLCRTDTVLCFDLDLQSDFGFVPRSRQGQSTPTVCQLHAEWLRAGHRRTDQDRVWRELAPTEIDTMPLAQLLNSEPPNGHGQRASASRSPISSVAALAPEPSPSVDIEQLVEELPLPHPSSLDPRDAPPYQQPVLLTSFSYGPQRQLILDERRDDSLRVLRHPPATLPHDLNQGFESATWRDDLVDEGLDSLLDSCVLPRGMPSSCPTTLTVSCSLLEARATVPEPDRSAFDARLSATRLITWRGMLTRILASVYETPNSDGWEMNAMYLDNTLFLEDRKSAKAGRSSDEKSRQTYYGYAFESWATAEPGVRDPDPSPDDVNTNVQWCAVVKATLGDIRMVLGGEVDCLVGHKPGEPIVPDSFVELKTSIELATDKDRRKFERFKALKFYLQSCALAAPSDPHGD